MPIANTPLTALEFDTLQQNISNQSESMEIAGTMAQSGLEYVVLLQVVTPEVDLVTPFADHLVNIEGFDSDSNFTVVVSSLNTHAINRGTTIGVNDTVDTRLNRYLSENFIQVTARYQRLSSGAGYIIDGSNVE